MSVDSFAKMVEIIFLWLGIACLGANTLSAILWITSHFGRFRKGREDWGYVWLLSLLLFIVCACQVVWVRFELYR